MQMQPMATVRDEIGHRHRIVPYHPTELLYLPCADTIEVKAQRIKIACVDGSVVASYISNRTEQSKLSLLEEGKTFFIVITKNPMTVFSVFVVISNRALPPTGISLVVYLFSPFFLLFLPTFVFIALSVLEGQHKVVRAYPTFKDPFNELSHVYLFKVKFRYLWTGQQVIALFMELRNDLRQRSHKFRRS